MTKSDCADVAAPQHFANAVDEIRRPVEGYIVPGRCGESVCERDKLPLPSLPKTADRLDVAFIGYSLQRMLITGPPGSGKTHLASALRRYGANAHDADDIEGLCGWFGPYGQRVPYPLNAGESFLNTHRFRWGRAVLKDFLDGQRVVSVFGSSSNVFDMIDLFDRVFFLKTPHDLLRERLRSQDRANPMGRTDYQVRYCLERARQHEAVANTLALPMIDSTLSPERLFLTLYPEANK